jgi:DNA-binding MarR family transcriptional regulator
VTATLEVRVRSKRLFGNSYMLEVCAALGSVEDRTNLTELLGESGLSRSLYVAPLRRLLAEDLVALDPRPTDDRRERWYRPADTGLWRVAQELAT